MANETKKLTFFKKTPSKCPSCAHPNIIEEMLTGRGRMSAGILTNELRRLYEETGQFGVARPMMYGIYACNKCYYASLPADFAPLPRTIQDRVAKHEDHRKRVINDLFGTSLDFSKPRDLDHAIGAYVLALSCYSVADPASSPTAKRAICALRAAWLLGDRAEEGGGEKFKYLENMFYQKAASYYKKVIDYEQRGKEVISNVRNLGPDTDKNFGFDGVKYLSCILSYKLSPAIEDTLERGLSFVLIRRTLGKLFGFGEKSKDKPGALLEIAKTLYEKVGEKVTKIEEQLGQKLD